MVSFVRTKPRSCLKCEFLGCLHYTRRLMGADSYFDYMNLSVSLLDPELYTAQKTYWRSPFLFTVGKCGCMQLCDAC